jgi:oligopeptide transport system substrate-binding protein
MLFILSKQKIFLAALPLVMLLFFISCNSNQESEENIFRYNESDGITSLDPAFARDFEIMWATNQLFDGLVELDSALEIKPCIAQSWEISHDGLTYTFHLRNNVLFHPSPLFEEENKRKVIASDFCYSFSRIIDADVASPGQWIFAHVDTTTGAPFTAPDDSTLVIKLAQPFQPFLGILTTQYCNVVPKEVVEHYGPDFRNHPIGTGPFKFAFWYEEVAMVFHRFENFWQKDEMGNSLPYLSAVKIDFVKDVSVEFQGLLQGKYDFISGINASFKDELLTPDGKLSEVYKDMLKFQKTPFIKTDYLGILVDPNAEISKNSPLLNTKIRAAIHHAINKREMVRYLRNNTVFPAESGFVPPALLGSSHLGHEDTYNPALAQKLLSEAGFPGGNGLPEIVCSSTADYADLLEYIQHELEKVGIKVRVNILQGSTFREQSAKAQLAVFRKSWLADYADAENFLSVFYSPNFAPAGPNYTHFTNSEFDLLYQKASTETDDNARLQLYKRMDSLVSSYNPVIPLYYDQVSHFIRKNISGLQTNPVNMLDLKVVRKTDH